MDQQASWVCAHQACCVTLKETRSRYTVCCIREERSPFFFKCLAWRWGLCLVSFSGVSRENPTGELQTSCIPVPRHESLSFRPLLRCVQTLSLHLKSLNLPARFVVFIANFLPPFVPVELVKAADIKVIAALGNSLTVLSNVLVLQLCGLDNYDSYNI